MSIAIKVENLSKRYELRHQKAEPYATLRDSLARSCRDALQRLRHPFARGTDDATREDFWALNDLNFEIHQGDRVGIIGRNGAGKSTLLKILSRITEPTTGRIALTGRVASLLEVGTGFHPELTGRENIFLNGALLGMPKSEIRKKFDAIVEFAEVERFLDTPVKRYSSGMYVRLAFAVAAHLDPEVMIVDEVLAVGDAHFQKKCLGKMEELGDKGRTVLFVSHNMNVINALCDTGIVLDKGRIVAKDEVNKAIQFFLHDSAVSRHRYVNDEPDNPAAKARLREARFISEGSGATVFLTQAFAIAIEWELKIKVPFLRLGVEVIDGSGIVIVSTMDTDTTDWHGKPREPGTYLEEVSFPAYLLMPGEYSVRVFAGIPRVERILQVEDVLSFEVLDNNTHLSHLTGTRRDGYVAQPLPWSIERENA